MDDFNNRMDAQRKVLGIVNKKFCSSEKLFGLSRKAIERWIGANAQKPHDPVPLLLFAISDKLFFLANKSQEQVSDEYISLSSEVADLTSRLDGLNT